MRTTYCGLVDEKLIGQTVTLYGWAHRRRDHGGVIFIDLRDREGLVQVVCDPDRPDVFATADKVRNEFCLAVVGTVRARPEGTKNDHLVSGGVEVLCHTLEILNPSLPPPFQLDDDTVSESARLTYRVLDLRREQMQRNLKLRFKVTQAFRHFLDENGFIDYEDVLRKARECRPQLILAGASAYSRIIDFQAFADAAREVGAYFMVDMAHIAGLVAAGDHPSPFGLADIITTTTHKTLRGTRGGLIFCKPELAKRVDSAVFPGCQGGALQHVIAGKAVTAEEASTEEFREYIHAVVRNCKAMCDEFISMGYKVVTGSTDNHLFLLDLTDTGLTGKAVQDELDRHGITLNKNCVPNETRSPQQTSGVRIGTAAMTTKGYTDQDFIAVARQIDRIIRDMQDMRKE